MSEHEFGRYTGKLILDPSGGSQQAKTTLEFGFLDRNGRHWPVPSGTSVGAASIPRALRSLLGDWRQGMYREAIVVHDYYCAARSTDWPEVYRIFYQAMLVSGVPMRRAKLVYAGVYFAGPRWQNRPVNAPQTGQLVRPRHTSPAVLLYALCRDPVALAMSEAITCNGRSAFEWITAEQTDTGGSQTTLELGPLSAMLEENDPSLPELEAAIDYAVSLIPGSESAARDLSVGRTTLLD